MDFVHTLVLDDEFFLTVPRHETFLFLYRDNFERSFEIYAFKRLPWRLIISCSKFEFAEGWWNPSSSPSFVVTRFEPWKHWLHSSDTFVLAYKDPFSVLLFLISKSWPDVGSIKLASQLRADQLDTRLDPSFPVWLTRNSMPSLRCQCFSLLLPSLNSSFLFPQHSQSWPQYIPSMVLPVVLLIVVSASLFKYTLNVNYYYYSLSTFPFQFPTFSSSNYGLKSAFHSFKDYNFVMEWEDLPHLSLQVHMWRTTKRWMNTNLNSPTTLQLFHLKLTQPMKNLSWHTMTSNLWLPIQWLEPSPYLSLPYSCSFSSSIELQVTIHHESIATKQKSSNRWKWSIQK